MYVIMVGLHAKHWVGFKLWLAPEPCIWYQPTISTVVMGINCGELKVIYYFNYFILYLFFLNIFFDFFFFSLGLRIFIKEFCCPLLYVTVKSIKSILINVNKS